MKLTEFEEHLITEAMPVGASGKTLQLTWDANKFVGELGRRMARVYRESAEKVLKQEGATLPDQKPASGRGKKKPAGESRSLVVIADRLANTMELNAALDDIEKAIYADALACDRYVILKDWDMEDADGGHVQPSYDVLFRQRTAILKSIFEFCREQSLPKKPETGTPHAEETSLTTSSTINDGSSPQTTSQQESPNTSRATT